MSHYNKMEYFLRNSFELLSASTILAVCQDSSIFSNMVVALVNYTCITEVNGLITLQCMVANVWALCEVIEVLLMFVLLVSMFFKWAKPLDTCQSFACHPFHQRAWPNLFWDYSITINLSRQQTSKTLQQEFLM